VSIRCTTLPLPLLPLPFSTIMFVKFFESVNRLGYALYVFENVTTIIKRDNL